MEDQTDEMKQPFISGNLFTPLLIIVSHYFCYRLTNISLEPFFKHVSYIIFQISPVGSMLTTTLNIFHMCARLSHLEVIQRLIRTNLLLTASWRMISISCCMASTVRHDRWKLYSGSFDDIIVDIDLCTRIYLSEYYDCLGICMVYPRIQ